MKAISGQGPSPAVLDNDAAKLADVIDSSLHMVCKSSADIGVISRKYGQIAPGPEAQSK
jgi:hypothetical protein